MSTIKTALQIQTTLSSIEAATSATTDEEDVPSSEEKVRGEDTDHAVTGVGSLVLYSVAIFAFLSAGLAMYITQFALVDFSCMTMLVLAPVAIAQKRTLNKLGTFRAQQNVLRVTINKLFLENTKLKQSVTQMEGDVNELQGVEQDLEMAAQKLGGHADRLYQTIVENDVLQKQIQKNLQSQIIQNILTSALKQDSDEDFRFDATELKRLKMSISQIPGVTFDSQNFDKLILDSKKELKLSDIMRMFRNILNQETPEDKRIVRLTPRKIVQRGFFG